MLKFKRILKIITVCAYAIGMVVFIWLILPLLLILAVPFLGYGTYLLLNEQDKIKELYNDRTK